MARRSAVYGELQATGRALSMPVPVDRVGKGEKGGYAPERLDPILGTLVDNADRGAQLLEKYTPLMAQLLEKLQEYIDTITKPKGEDETHNVVDVAVFVDVVDKIANIVERVSKVMLSTVKAKDDATRLRVFLAGDQAPDDLSTLGEQALRKIVEDASRGWAPADGEGENTP